MVKMISSGCLLLLLAVGWLSADDVPGPKKKNKSDYDRIIKRNIFSPPRPEAPEKEPEKTPEADPEPPPFLPAWKITGIFYREKDQEYRVILEHAEEGSRVMRAGQDVGDVRIVRVEQDHVCLEKADKEWSLRTGERFGEPGTEREDSASSEEEGEAASKMDDSRRKAILERMKKRREKN